MGENKNYNPFPEIQRSILFILNKIKESGENPNDLTVVGLSQGGFMALYLTLNNIIKAKKTIAVVPFYRLNLIKADNLNRNTPILWASAGKDTTIPSEYTGTWRYLQALRVNLTHVHSAKSQHGNWCESFKNSIVRWSKQH